MNKKYFSSLLLLMAMIGLGIATPTLAQTDKPSEGGMGKPPSGMMQKKPGVMGKVTAISGNTITITGKQGPATTEDTTYTVDASSAKIEKDMVTISVSNIAVGDTLMIEGTVSGTSVTATSIIDGVGKIPSDNKTSSKKGTSNKEPGVMGKVTAISGTTITITSKNSAKKTTSTSITYTVDASNATIKKNNVSGSISDIVVGDTISVDGTISGTSITATNIRDGMGTTKKDTSSTDSKVVADSGNGQPVVAGTVTIINGSVLTITNKSNVTYTIDTTNAKIIKDQDTVMAVSDIAVGDTVIVQGTINGTAIVASSVIDQAKATTTDTTTTTEHKGFFGSIGSFFANLFGF